MKVALFGSSFNPPHIGHVTAVKYFARYFDEVWLLPVYRHMYSSKSNLLDYSKRFELTKLAFEGCSNVHVKNVEKEAFEFFNKSRNNNDVIQVGSIDILEYLIEKYGDKIEFSWIVGADAYHDICAGKWKRGDVLLQKVNMEIMERKGCREIDLKECATEQANQNVAAKKITKHEVPFLTDVSSTQVRNCSDESTLRNMVPESVASYIVSRKLYAFEENNQ